jgi:hypothetical protein
LSALLAHIIETCTETAERLVAFARSHGHAGLDQELILHLGAGSYSRNRQCDLSGGLSRIAFVAGSTC